MKTVQVIQGSSENPVGVNLENLNAKIKGVSVDICDEGNYLTCTGCGTTARTAGFSCSTNELEDGCVKLLFFSSQDYLIEEGSGPILTLQYDTSGGAPYGEYRNLNPEEVSMAGEDGNPLQAPVIVEPGKFPFFYCNSDHDCDDGLFCNSAETCLSGYCQSGVDPCPDDEIFCNGMEGCDEVNDVCTHSGNPCPPRATCNEADDVCNCSQDEDCDDKLFCNGEEYCIEGTCGMAFDYL